MCIELNFDILKGGIFMLLKIERVKRNLSQKQLSKMSGVGLNIISKIETGKIDNVTFGYIRKLAKALDIPVEELIKEEEV